MAIHTYILLTVATSGANLYPPGVWFADICRVVFSVSAVINLCFVLLRFRRYAFVEAAVFRSIVLRYAGAQIATHTHTRVSFFSFFLMFIWNVAFSDYFFCTIIAVFSFYGEYVLYNIRSFLPDNVFLPCDHGLDFLHQLT